MVIKVKIKQVQIIVNCIIYCKWAVTTTVDSLPDSYCPSLGTKAWIHQTVLPLCRIMFMFTRENKLLLLLFQRRLSVMQSTDTKNKNAFQ